MPAFEEFRRWSRLAPASERATAAVATAVVVAVLGWTFAPSGGHEGSAVTALDNGAASTASVDNAGAAAGPAANPTGSVTTTGSAPTGSATSGAGAAAATGGATGGAATASGSGRSSGQKCVSPPADAPGVTATQIKVAITPANIVGPAGNETFGGAPADEVTRDFQAIVDDINRSGGVACRKLVPTYIQVNPADNSDMQQKCLDIVSLGVFAEIDGGGEALAPECFPRNRMTYVGGNRPLVAKELSDFYPYLFSPWGTYDATYHDLVFGLRDMGFFNPAHGFKKLGFVYMPCHPETITEFTSWLHQAGLSDAQIVGYDMGCPSPPLASPGDMEQAVLKFRQAGVTNVTYADFAGNFSNFTSIAQQQGFTPKYGIPDDSIISISYGNQHPDYSNIAGAIAVTTTRYGEERTPSLRMTPATAKCDAILRSIGKPSLYKYGLTGGVIGSMCNQLWSFKAALEHAPVISRSGFALGWQAARSVDYSWPFGPNDFSGNRGVTGGQFWRADEFRTSCTCWQVINAAFRRNFS